MSKENAVSASKVVPTCRICGCTEDHACEGGCSWVSDPEGIGDLCSKCLTNPNYTWEIPLEKIRPAPWNPPSRLDPKKVEGLADSIKKEGQKQDGLVRPVEAEAPVEYEIVFGHRRSAARKLLSEKYDAAFGVLRCKIEEMGEERAMILTGIENLQRKDYSEVEEAEFFRTCGEKYGESAVTMLSEKLSVSPRYIRKRIEFLKLPEVALELWRPGIWHVGHMEQLLRLGSNDQVEAFFVALAEDRRVNPKDLAVWQLKDMIDHLAVALHSGRFDKADCKTCRKNTDVQRKLFGSEKEKTKCLDQDCFRSKQQAWFDAKWLTCKENKFNTQTAIIGDFKTKYTASFCGYSGPVKVAEKCQSCSKYATIVSLQGQMQNYSDRNQVCMGEKSCFEQVEASSKKENRANSSKAKDKVDPDTPRVPWHGEHFRQEFYQQEIPSLMANLLADDSRRLQIALAVMVNSADELCEWLCEKVGVEPPAKEKWRDHATMPFPRLLKLVKSLNGMQAEILLAEALTLIALHTAYGKGNWNCRLTFIDPDRQALAEFLDIDWSRFQVTEEYLEKKTKGEIVRFIVHESGLFQLPEFKDAMLRQGISSALTPEKLAALKKPVLVDLLLKGGVDLRGRLPKEIADRPKLQEEGE